MEQIAEWINEAITARGDDQKLEHLHATIRNLTKAFPLPGDK